MDRAGRRWARPSRVTKCRWRINGRSLAHPPAARPGNRSIDAILRYGELICVERFREIPTDLCRILDQAERSIEGQRTGGCEKAWAVHLRAVFRAVTGHHGEARLSGEPKSAPYFRS